MDLRVRTLLAYALTLGCVERVGAGDAGGESSGESDGVDESGSIDGSSSDSGSDSDAAESDSDSTTIGFTCECDVGPGLIECDPFLQDCAEGDKCVPYGGGDDWIGHRCLPVTGDRAAGEACEYGSKVLPIDDCDDTSMCWNLVSGDGGWVGTCVPFCTGTPDAPICPPGMTCMISRDVPVWCE